MSKGNCSLGRYQMLMKFVSRPAGAVIKVIGIRVEAVLQFLATKKE
jgi:hypothetical protein